MTNPYEPTDPYAQAPYHQPPQGWGYYPQPPPRRPWWHAPGSLIGAATFSAVFSWLATGVIVLGAVWLPQLEVDSFESFIVMIFFGIFVVGLLFVVGIASFCLAVAGAAATVPLAIAWWRGPDRSRGAVACLANAVVAWLVLAFLVIHFGLYRELF